MYDLIIIGGGPAGIAAAIYVSRQKLKTLMITKGFGGQVAKKAVDIENYPGFVRISGQGLIKKFEEHLKNQEIDIKKDEVIKVEKGFVVSTAGRKKYRARAVIVASGADPRPLEVPGEKEFLGRGLSYCAVCDGSLFRGKVAAIIGGGNSAFETAIYLANYIKKLYILECGSKVGADETNQKIVKKSGKVEIIANAFLKEIKGKNFVDSVVYQDLKTKKEKTLKVEGVFVEIGYQPATSFVRGLVDFNENDEIKVECETCQTRTPGLFAAGDVNVGTFRQIVTACGEGAKAALAAYKYLQK